MKKITLSLYEYKDLSGQAKNKADEEIRRELLCLEKTGVTATEKTIAALAKVALENVGLLDEYVHLKYEIGYQGPEESYLSCETEEFDLEHFLATQDRETRNKFKDLVFYRKEWPIGITVSIWAYLNGAKPYVTITPDNKATKPLKPLLLKAVKQVTSSLWPEAKKLLEETYKQEESFKEHGLADQSIFLENGTLWKGIKGVNHHVEPDEPAPTIPPGKGKKQVAGEQKDGCLRSAGPPFSP